MKIPGLSTLKTWAVAALSFLSVVLFAVGRAKDASRAKADRKRTEAARQTEQAATKAMLDGLEREQEAVDEAHNTSGKRDHFE